MISRDSEEFQQLCRTVERIAGHIPTPEPVAVRMLEFAGLRAGETLFDLGSGDGRIVILAASKFGASATGIEYKEQAWRSSSEKIKELGLEASARIIHGDLFEQDFSSADVVTLYLQPAANDRLLPLLERQLKPGARIVSHDFSFSDWEADEIAYLEQGDYDRNHALFLYRR